MRIGRNIYFSIKISKRCLKNVIVLKVDGEHKMSLPAVYELWKERSQVEYLPIIMP